MIEYNTLVVLCGVALLGAGAGLVGCFAVLRGQALAGDALAHAALPGLCVAFLIVGDRHLPAMLGGALIAGLLGVAVIAGLRRGTRIKQDAALGIVLSVFFGAGVSLSRWIQASVAEGSKAGLDSFILGKTAGMILSDVYWLTGIAAVSLFTIVACYKEFKLVAFDAEFARVQGWPAGWLDALLMGLIAITVVVGLPAVGVVLMAAMLILPAAAARFWTDRLGKMLVLSSVLGAVAGIIGVVASAGAEGLPAGPIIVLAATALFAISLTFGSRRGLVIRWRRSLAAVEPMLAPSGESS